MIGIYGTSDRALILASSLAEKDQAVFIYTPEEEALEEIMDGHLKQFQSPVDEVFRKADKTKKISYSGNLQTLLNCEVIFLSGRLVQGETDPKAALRFIEQDILSLLRKAVDNRKKADNFNLVLIDELPYGGYQVLVDTILNTNFEVGENYLEDDLSDSDILPVLERDGKKSLQFNLALSPLIEPKDNLILYAQKPQEAVIGSFSESLIGRLKEIYKLLGVSKKSILISTPNAVETGLLLKDAYTLMQQVFVNEAAALFEGDFFYELIRSQKIPQVSTQLNNSLIERVRSLSQLDQNLKLFDHITELGQQTIEKANQKLIDSLLSFYQDKDPDTITLSIVGTAQKPGSSDMRGAQVIGLIEALTEQGFKIKVFMKEGTTDLKWRLRESNERITYSKDLYTCIKGTDALLVLGKIGHSVDLKRVLRNMNPNPILYDPLSLFRDRKDLNAFILI